MTVDGPPEAARRELLADAWAIQARAEAADVRAAMLLGAVESPTPVIWNISDESSALRTEPGSVTFSAEVLGAARAGGPFVPRPPAGPDSGADVGADPLAWSVLVAATALAAGAAGRQVSVRWPATAVGGLDPAAPAEWEPQDRADLLAAVLLAADEEAPTVASALAAYLPHEELRAAARRAFVASLAHPEPSRAQLARRRAGSVVTSGWLLADLAAAYRQAARPEVRDALAEAHHRIGKAVLAAPDARAVSRIRRSTHTGRLYRLDRLIAQIAALAQDEAAQPGVVAGVDTALLRSSLCAAGEAGTLRIRDEAVSDGRTTVDLWHALSAVGARGELVGGDRYSGFVLARGKEDAGLLAADGSCLQVECGPPGGAPAGRAPQPGEPAVAALESADHRRPLRWVTPLAPPEAQREDAPLRLRFRDHDVFAPDPEPAHLIRACGLLYRRLRSDVDAETYFPDAEITAALALLGAGLHPGGVLVVGSVIDSADDAVRHTDADVFQRLDGEGGPVLRHCARIGLGLGPAVPEDRPILLTHHQEGGE
ncbi:hypothetical protein [Kitasatospora atroaurantiaca]